MPPRSTRVAAAPRARFAALLLALAAAVALTVAPAASAASSGDAAPTALERALAGIPQRGPWLGRPDAPVVVELYADLQCPHCRAFSQQTLPRLVRRWVADGTVRMRYRFVTWLGRDSVRMARFAIAAGDAGLLWQTAGRLLGHQAAETSGYATDSFLLSVGAQVPGLDASANFAAARADATLDPLRAARRSARLLGVDGVPALGIGRRGGPLRRFDGDPARLREISAAIKAALRR